MKLGELIAPERVEAANACLAEEAAKAQAPKDPVALTIAIGVGSWFSSLFVLGFLIAAFEPSEKGALALGALLMAASIGLHLKAHRLPVFLEQCVLASIAAGHLLVLFGAGETIFDSYAAPLNFAIAHTLLCLVGLFAFRKGIYRISSLLLAVILWIHTALEMSEPLLYQFLLVLQAVLFGIVALWRAKSSSYIFALAASLFASIFYLDWMHANPWGNILQVSIWPANLCMVGLLACTCGRILPELLKHRIWIGLGILLLAILAYASTAGILLGVGLIVYGRGSRQRLIEGLGVAGLFTSVGYYYYSLKISLLMKSGTMLMSGLICLLIASLAYRYLKDDQGSEVGG